MLQRLSSCNNPAMVRPPARSQPIDPRTRTAILDATVEVASRIGLGRLSVEDVARSASVSRQTVYRYFGSRDELISAVIVREEQTLIRRMVAAGERHDDLRPAMEAALTESLRAAREHPLLDRILATEPEALLPFLTTGAGPVLGAAAPVVSELLRRFVPHLTEPELQLVVDAITRLMVSYAVNPPSIAVEDLAAGLADLVVNGVKQ